MLVGKLVKHRLDDSSDVGLLVAETVTQSVQRGIGHLQLRSREVQRVREILLFSSHAGIMTAHQHEGKGSGLLPDGGVERRPEDVTQRCHVGR
jgi:hypothetical protein